LSDVKNARAWNPPASRLSMNATGWSTVHWVSRAEVRMCASIACLDAKCGTAVGTNPPRATDVYTKCRTPAACAASKKALPCCVSVSTVRARQRRGLAAEEQKGRTGLAGAGEDGDVEDAVERRGHLREHRAGRGHVALDDAHAARGELLCGGRARGARERVDLVRARVREQRVQARAALLAGCAGDEDARGHCGRMKSKVGDVGGEECH
jgi:hypothetical protein